MSVKTSNYFAATGGKDGKRTGPKGGGKIGSKSLGSPGYTAASGATEQEIAAATAALSALKANLNAAAIDRLDADLAIDAAIDRVSAALTATVPSDDSDQALLAFPADGRYRISDGALVVDLRIDLEGSNIVSGDLYAEMDGVSEHLAGFRTEPGLALSVETSPLPIVLETSDGKTGRGSFWLDARDDKVVQATLFIDDNLPRLPFRVDVPMVGRFVSNHLRDLTIERTMEADVTDAPAWPMGEDTATIESAFGRVGFDVAFAGLNDLVPTPPGGRWHDEQLHALMVSYADAAIDRPDWTLQLLQLQESLSSRLLGVMFDAGNMDTNGLPRQGAAVFERPIGARPDRERKLLQTTLHELGHALNLAHRFEQEVGAANSTSIMNYDWKFLGGGNEAKYWSKFDFSFDPDELAFLRHGPRHAIIPGGAEFHSVAYWENRDGGYVPYQPEVPGDEIEISIAPPPAGPVFAFGQPVILGASAKNVGTRRMNLPWYLLDPKVGLTGYVVRRINGGRQSDAKTFRPIVNRCIDRAAAVNGRAADIVAPGGTLDMNVQLTFGSAGFTFAEPGTYEIQAIMTLSWRSGRVTTYRSNRLRIRVAAPQGVEEEREALVLTDPEAGRYFVFGGTHGEGGDSIHEHLVAIAERRSRPARGIKRRRLDPVGVFIERSAGLRAARGHVHYDAAQSAHVVVEPDYVDAAARLKYAVEDGGRVLDEWTRTETSKLADHLTNMIQQ